MQNTKDIQQAISAYMAAEGETVESLGKKLGVSHVSVVRWRSGDIKRITTKNWVALRDLISPYMRKRPQALPNPDLDERDGETLRRVPDSEKVSVPVLGAAAAAGYDSVLEPLGEFLDQFDATEDWLASDVKAPADYFTLFVEGDSMSPEFPSGTALLVAGGTFPQRGDLVVARLADLGEVVVKEYRRQNGTVELCALNPEGKSYTIDTKAEPGRLLWMWPVVQAKIDLRKRRWERTKA